ncbi:hypothetical protein PG997_005382 [Apiospora hydei]|uniref:Uncharacterized protein n=1 Tax=Apiospora hydei TaxID=1337664 RepID=A0ABR1X4T4_9PEZI
MPTLCRLARTILRALRPSVNPSILLSPYTRALLYYVQTIAIVALLRGGLTNNDETLQALTMDKGCQYLTYDAVVHPPPGTITPHLFTALPSQLFFNGITHNVETFEASTSRYPDAAKLKLTKDHDGGLPRRGSVASRAPLPVLTAAAPQPGPPAPSSYPAAARPEPHRHRRRRGLHQDHDRLSIDPILCWHRSFFLGTRYERKTEIVGHRNSPRLPRILLLRTNENAAAT